MSVEDPEWAAVQPPGVQLKEPVLVDVAAGRWKKLQYEADRPTTLQKIEMAGRPRRLDAEDPLTGPKTLRKRPRAMSSRMRRTQSVNQIERPNSLEISLAKQQLQLESEMRRIAKHHKVANSALQKLREQLAENGGFKEAPVMRLPGELRAELGETQATDLQETRQSFVSTARGGGRRPASSASAARPATYRALGATKGELIATAASLGGTKKSLAVQQRQTTTQRVKALPRQPFWGSGEPFVVIWAYI